MQRRPGFASVFAACAVAAIAGAGSLLFRPGHGGPETMAASPSASSGASTVGATAEVVNTGRAVPWTRRTDFSQWTWPTPTPRPQSAPCRGNDLRLKPTTGDGATGHVAWWLTLVNHGNRPCTLAGPPGLVGTDSHGRSVAVQAERGTFFKDPYQERPATLDPGDTAVAAVETSMACEPQLEPTRYSDLVLVLLDGTRIATGRDLTTACTVRVDDWSRADSGYVEPPARYPGLTARLAVPAAVAPGTVVEYVVTLTNTAQKPIDLSPCPGYRQELRATDARSMAAGKDIVQGEWRLACEGLPAIAPGASQQFAMRLPVPTAATGNPEVLLSWRLIDMLPDEAAEVWLPVSPHAP